MKTSLYKNSHRLGYNTRDNPQDIPIEACQSLVNLFPGDPMPRPRGGITAFTDYPFADQVDDIIPFADVEIGDRLFFRIDDTWYQLEQGTTPPVYIGNGFPTAATISWTRVRDAIYIITDDVNSPAWIIQKDGAGLSTFTLRKANISRPALTISLTRTGVGNIAQNKHVRYAFTFVNRMDADSVDGSGYPKLVDAASGVFHPGVLESIDNLADRRTFTDATVGGSSVAGEVVTNAALDAQVTHMRVYRTEEAASAVEAEGLSLRWEMDVPVKGPNSSGTLTHTFTSNKTTATMAGILDLLKVVGYSVIPAGTICFFYQNRLWVGGEYTGERIGRWYYSETTQDVEFPQKWLSMFKEDELFKDTCLDSSEQSMGMEVAGTDLYFWMRNSLWFLREGDPDFEPLLVEGSWGTAFPKAITRVGDSVAFLSAQGPAVVSGRRVDVLEAFTAGEVWPDKYDGHQGYFFTLTAAQKRLVQGWYFADTWWVANSSKWIGHHMPANKKAMGPMEIIPAYQNQRITRAVVLSDMCVIMYATSSGTNLWRFLDPSTKYDFDNCYTMTSRSKSFYVNGFNPEQIAELYDLLFHASWTDDDKLSFRIIGDLFRFNTVLEYKQFDAASALLSPAELSNTYRKVIQQGFAEGLFARSFEVEWQKHNKYPFDFLCRGFTIRLKKLNSFGHDFVGGNFSDDDRLSKRNDAGEVGDDRTAFDHNDAGVVGRDLCDYTIKDAQVRN